VGDSAAVLQVIAGYDSEDPTSVNEPVPDYLAALKSSKPVRTGIARGFFFEELDSEVAAAVEQALVVLEGLFGKAREIKLEVPTERALQAAESYAYHAEFIARSANLYQPETLRRIRSGENTTAPELQALRQDLLAQRKKIGSVFDEVDVLIAPTTPILAPNLEELKQNFELLRPRELLLLRNTRPFNVWGLPAISIPCGFTATGLPIGLQLAAKPWDETTLLRIAHAYEQATDWKSREPKVV
jgi:aspartyl-tRNA(Asn)/glutamyl-tRNA(Gln) amidotransferase subunit A